MRLGMWAFMLLVVATNFAMAETKSIDARGYYTRVHDPETVDLPGMRTLQPNFTRHIIYESPDGDTESHWCAGSNIYGLLSLEGGGGYCVVIDSDGDAYWLWYEMIDGGYRWEVMKGIGEYAGARGSGTATAIKALADGSGVFHSRGKLELPD